MGVPQEIEAVSIRELIRRSSRQNIYEVVVAISQRSAEILTELNQEFRQKLEELEGRDDLVPRDEKQMNLLRQELSRWLEYYRSLPKASLIALWEKLHEPPAS